MFVYFFSFIFLAVPVKKVGNAVTCEICEYAMQYLDAKLKANSTKEEVKAALDGLCAELPIYQTEVCGVIKNVFVKYKTLI